MNKIIVCVLALVSVVSVGCSHLTVEQARANTPKGAKVCHTDFDCPSNSYCGFAGVDQLPTCRYSPGSDAFSLSPWHYLPDAGGCGHLLRLFGAPVATLALKRF